jgi:hypothetical protein
MCNLVGGRALTAPSSTDAGTAEAAETIDRIWMGLGNSRTTTSGSRPMLRA